MPSPPPPTTLQSGDPVWWQNGTSTRVGTVHTIHPGGQQLDSTPQDSDGSWHITLPQRLLHPRQVHIPDVVGPAEALEILDGISRQRFHELRRQPHFPLAAELAQGQVWSRPELIVWQHERKVNDGRSQRRARFLMSYRKLGSVYAAAASTRVPKATAYRWANELGLISKETAP